MARIDQFTKSKLAILGKQPAAVQADVFLRAFCGTFAVEKRSGVFEATLEHAAAFQAALRVNTARTGEQCHALEEDLAHQFLETHVHPLTVVEMRAAFRELDLDQTHQMSFVEYLIWLHHVPVASLFTEPEDDHGDEVEAAMAELAALTAAINARLLKEAQLEAMVEAGGFHGAKASIELAELRRKRRTKENVAAVNAESKLKRANLQALASPLKSLAVAPSLDHPAEAFAAEQVLLSVALACQKRRVTRGQKCLAKRPAWGSWRLQQPSRYLRGIRLPK